MARAELGDKVSQAGSGVGKLAFALVLGLGAVVILLLAAVEGLSEDYPRWLAALIVGGAAAIAAGLFASWGRSDLKAKNLVPTRTIESVKEDARFAKEKVT